MALFPNHKESQEKIQALEARVEELEGQLQAATDEAATSAQTAQEAVSAKDAVQAELTEAQTALAAKDAELAAKDAKITELEQSLEDDAPRIAAAAAKELASIGHEPVEKVETTDPITEAQIREAFDKMPAGAERSAFYQKHRKVLAGA